MDEYKRPEAHGSPSEKAREALGEKINRPSKTPPPFPEKPSESNEPSARAVEDEVDDL